VRPFSYMMASFSKSSIPAAAAIAVGLFSLALSACSGPASSFSSAAAVPQRSQSVKPLNASSPTPSPIPFVFQTVDDPNSNFNEVNGINQLSKIVGTYGSGQGSNIYNSYNSLPPYTVFHGVNDQGSQGTVATSLSSNKDIAGYVIDPSGLPAGIYAFVRINSLFTLLSDSNEGTGNDAVTEILGINDSGLAVGFYVNPSGIDVPFELNIPTVTFTELKPPGSVNAEATGINGKGNISGWESTNKGTEGFYLQAGTYYPFLYPGSQATYALSLNWQDQIVGDYIDSHGKTHGFLLTGPTRGGAKQQWQVIDEPNAAAGTWVTGISNHEDICGYYVDASGVQHGFVAVP
jgi:hypothetical protein